MTRRRGGRRAARVAGAGMAVCALLAGCVSIPGEGPVQIADKVTFDQPRAQGRGADPSPLAGPERTIEMFLGTALDYVDDHAVARKYLMPGPGPRLRWRPENPVTVFSGAPEIRLGAAGATPSLPPAAASATPAPASATSSAAPAPGPASPTPTPRVGDTATVTVTVSVYARITASGQFSRARTGERETRTFRLGYTRDGWRISSLDNGILLYQVWFAQIYRALPVYFADRRNAYLVPDVRWFPVEVGLGSTPSAVVSTVLGGPSSWLAPAVEDVVPTGTHLTVSGVKIVNGVATVDLSQQVREADARQRRVLMRQLDATLTGDELVVPASRVLVTVEQQALEMQPSVPADGTRPSAPIGKDGPGGTDSAELRVPPDEAAPPVALDAKGTLVQLVGREPRPVADLTALASPTNSYPAAEPGGTAYAVLAADRTRLVHAQPAGAPVVLVTGRSLSPPSFDPFGWVWTSQEQAGGVVLAARPGREAKSAPQVQRLSVDWLGQARVRSLRISREGARAVVVLVPPQGPPQVVVCAVVRDAEGRPTALGPAQRLLPEAADVTGASWMDPTHVVVLARTAGQVDPVPWTVQLGGDVESTPAAPGAVAVTVDPQGQLWVTLANGAVQRRSIASWEPVPGVRYAAVPG